MSERDLELIDAMQINPRASWLQVGEALQMDPVTCARRWQRLVDAGEAWATVAFGRHQLHTMSVAFLEIDCEPGAGMRVAGILAEADHLITVQLVAGSCEIWAFAAASSLAGLSDYLLAGLPRVPGVRKIRTHMATRVFDASRRWRLRVLSQRARDRLAAEEVTPGLTRPMDELDRRIFLELSIDGRRSHADLAERLDASARTIQRRVLRMVQNGDIDFRCDLARPLAGWAASALLWLEVPDALLDDVGNALLRWRETRTCAAIVGPSNLLLTLGLYSASELHPLVIKLSKEFPHVRVIDRQLVLRPVKRFGRVLDSSGRCTGVVPPDPWALGQKG